MAWKPRERQIEDGRVVQYDTIKARLFPTPEQEELFRKTFDCCRYLWNQMLSDQQEFYYATDKHFIPSPAKYKPKAPFLTEVDGQALVEEHNKLSRAFRLFFNDPKNFGHPKFKKKKADKDSYTVYNHQHRSSFTIYTVKNGIRMTKAGIVKASFSRTPREGWRLKRITVERTKAGRYYCYILYEYTVEAPKPVTPAPEKTLGLKYSIDHFYVTDTGAAADPPRWMARSQEKLAKLQQQIQRAVPGSRNYEDAVQKYRKLHEHIRNQRYDYIHKEARRIANEWDAVCVRDNELMALDTMMSRLNPGAVNDAGFGMFREVLRYKLARQGKVLIEVDHYAPTTKTCSACGALRENVTHQEQTWTCSHCGAVHNREVNAARNIKMLGLSMISESQELRESA